MLPAHGRRLEGTRFSLRPRFVRWSSPTVVTPGPQGVNPRTFDWTFGVQKLDGLRRVRSFGGDARRIPLATPNSPL